MRERVRKKGGMSFQFLLVMLVVGGCAHGAQETVLTGTRKPICASLVGRAFVNVRITSATPVATAANPAYCEVLATENGTEHDIKVLLPDSWTGRLYQQGGGGFDGQIPRLLPPEAHSNTAEIALRSGAIVLANNGGYRDPTGAKLLNNPQAIERYAHTAIAIAKEFGNALANAYYGAWPKYSYYVGCSNGGRGAANAAADYADEYDGVISGAPGLNLVGTVEQWTRASALDLPDTGKLKAVAAAVVAKCDELDGVKDGIVSNWEACRFDPATDAPEAGLTPSEVDGLKALYSDIRLKDGTLVTSGLGYGDASFWARGYAMFGVGHMRYIVLNDSSWSPAGFDVDHYYQAIYDVMQRRYGFTARPEGLVAFLERGKKMIVWHGSDDSLLPHRDTIRVWQNAMSMASEKAQRNSRLYIASGVGHCAGGPGADTFDLLTPLLRWVENGVPPGDIMASKVDSATGKVLFTRPLCTYPQFPKYKGSGDVNKAESFTCAAK